ncbi:hypothetical protein B0H15DRAFT_458631 [Mycena belliarum]|uniref:Uncharacterized protein n=1 Tax=Mycena belliarum TaxID=1033014 RepID=A0AAD6XSR5_9AGAR|nr:hypothetical protein B0H15DRAFT_458631 [Mycena belliae]
MFFRFYEHPGLHLPPDKQAELRTELLQIARGSLDPVPNYQCLSTSPDALDDKLIVVAYTGTDPDDSDEAESETHHPRAVAFISALYLDVPGLAHAVLHTGLTVAAPSVQRSGIVITLCTQLFQHVMPRHPRGIWVTTLAAVLSSLVTTEQFLYNTYPCSPSRDRASPAPLQEHLAIARTIDARYRAQLLIAPAATFDEAAFVFRGSLAWAPAACFRKDGDDPRFWHRKRGENEYFRALMRPGMGDEALLVGFIDVERIWERLERRRVEREKARL